VPRRGGPVPGADGPLAGQPPDHGEEGLADLERVYDVLATVEESPPGSSGCLVVNLSAEVPAWLGGLAPRVDHYRRHLRDGFAAVLGRRGEIAPA
jgi:hypothetical protein